MGVRSSSKEMHQKDHSGSAYGYGYSLASSGTHLVSSLMKSWRISSTSPSKPNNNYTGDGNFDAMAKQQTAAMKNSSSAYSPLKYSTPVSSSSGSMSVSSRRASTDSLKKAYTTGSKYSSPYYRDSGGANNNNNNSNNNSNNSNSKKSGRFFRDLDEDWSAVIDDYNMPIPVITNGGVASPATPKGAGSPSLKTTPSYSTTATVNQNARSTFSYPQLPQLQRTLTADLRSKLEVENEREAQELTSMLQRISKFDSILKKKHIINQQELRQLSWNGIPKPQRPVVWKLLIGYLPANTKRQESLLKRKRQEYSDGLDHVFSEQHSRDVPTWHQIEIDIPRTNPHIPLYQFKSVQRSLQRVLYLWAIRHPASGYVQGINDLSTPFFQTFLTEYLPQSQLDDVEKLDPASYLTDSQLRDVEADTFWCLTKLLEQITDNYIHGQPGILKQVKNLSQLVKRIDQDLFNHLQSEHVEFIQFAFRWMNCLLMREFQMSTVIRMWDTYLSETSLETSSSSAAIISDTSSSHTSTEPASMTFQSFTSTNTTSKTSSEELSRLRRSSLNEFHVFVCAAFLIRWSDQLIDMDFQNVITFLQNPPTRDWKEVDIEMLLSEAYIWQSLYKDATSHWQ